MMDAAYWAAQKQVVSQEITRYLEHSLNNTVSVTDAEVVEYITEIYGIVTVANAKYSSGKVIQELDEVSFKEFKDAMEEDICHRVSEAVCEVLDNESGEVLDDYLPFHLKNLLRQYVGICSNLYRSDN